MIGYLQGTILKKRGDRLLLLAGNVGYEVLVPLVVAEALPPEGENAALFIHFHQTERQPKPVLIGFTTEEEREFFERFISVGDIGPVKAANALSVPVADIARAIESRDAPALQKLKGIGARTAQKIVAALHGKVGAYAAEGGGTAPARDGAPAPAPLEDFAAQVVGVLVNQLGHRQAEAREMVHKALARRPDIASPEELFDEVYRKEAEA